MKHTDATKHKLSEMRKGANNPFFGRKHTPETRARLAKHLRSVSARRVYIPADQQIRVPIGAALAYLAGIVDGEGSIRFAKGRPFVAIYNGHEPLMRWLCETLGGSYAAGDHRGRTPNYSWRVSGARDVAALCRALSPLLIVKRDDCAAAISHLETKYGF